MHVPTKISCIKRESHTRDLATLLPQVKEQLKSGPRLVQDIAMMLLKWNAIAAVQSNTPDVKLKR